MHARLALHLLGPVHKTQLLVMFAKNLACMFGSAPAWFKTQNCFPIPCRKCHLPALKAFLDGHTHSNTNTNTYTHTHRSVTCLRLRHYLIDTHTHTQTQTQTHKQTHTHRSVTCLRLRHYLMDTHTQTQTHMHTHSFSSSTHVQPIPIPRLVHNIFHDIPRNIGFINHSFVGRDHA
jgi:hypothetical protein